ncbi:MAG: GTPase HflX [Syntrophomonadaceae bacterium]|nr:GTPase HflX [Syntrophomonadaceae bacterium]
MSRFKREGMMLIMSQKCLLIGINDSGEDHEDLLELAALVQSSGNYEIVGTMIQKRSRADSRYYLGKGKLDSLKEMVDTLEADLVICDDELTPAQQRNIFRALEIPVTDRTGIILEIFSQRAHTSEGKIQVELAQLKYALPRLIGKGEELSRLAGGIGTRGPGESKLEMDRRTIRNRIRALEREIDFMTRHQGVTRKLRNQMDVPIVCLVGYTNAGKSSIMSLLSDSDGGADSRLFATLATTGHRIDFPDGGHFILSDTVGFINKLPHQLVASFRATLQEVKEADLLLHVIDAAEDGVDRRIKTVEQVLVQINAVPDQALKVYNKIDLLSAEEINKLTSSYPGGLLVSATTGVGKAPLLVEIRDRLFSEAVKIELIIPHNRGDLIAKLYEHTQILDRLDVPEGVELTVRGSRQVLGQIMQALEVNNAGG